MYVYMPEKKRKTVTVGFVALGCPKNMVDSERMLAQIAEAGFLIAAEPERADVVIINTCGFIEPAEDRVARSGRAGRREQETGPREEGDRRGLPVAAPGPSSFSIRPPAWTRSWIWSIATPSSRSFRIRSRPTSSLRLSRARRPARSLDDRVRLRIGPVHSAYLRISEGCSHRCSFCTIPAIRGPFRSKPSVAGPRRGAGAGWPPGRSS